MLNKPSCLWKGFDVFQEKAWTWMQGCLGKESVLLPQRKGSWEVVLDLLWPICLCCKETISPWLSTTELFLNTPHPMLLPKPWIEFFPNSLEESLPSPKPTFMISRKKVGGVKPMRKPLLWEKPVAWSCPKFSLLSYQWQTLPFPCCLGTCCCSCFSKSLLWMNELLNTELMLLQRNSN